MEADYLCSFCVYAKLPIGVSVCVCTLPYCGLVSHQGWILLGTSYRSTVTLTGINQLLKINKWMNECSIQINFPKLWPQKFKHTVMQNILCYKIKISLYWTENRPSLTILLCRKWVPYRHGLPSLVYKSSSGPGPDWAPLGWTWILTVH